jgi:hypothetical protein
MIKKNNQFHILFVKYVKFSVIFTENKVLTLEPKLWIIEKLFHIFFYEVCEIFSYFYRKQGIDSWTKEAVMVVC